MKKIVIGVSSENENDLVRKITVIQRQTDNLGNLIASGYTNQYGGLIIEVPDGEYLVIKEANSNVENSQVYDYVTPAEYQELSFKVVNYDSQWIYLKPQTIAMSYSNTVSIESFLGEFRINGGAWTTATFIKDGDTLEMRLPTPIGGVYSEAANYRIKVGPYTYQYKSFDDSAGLTILEHQTSFYRIQNIKASLYSFENQVSFFKIQVIRTI